MDQSPSIVRTRFAPSPSGHLHVGGARTALFCWAYAKGKGGAAGGPNGGKFMLRIEDTDQKRSSDAASMGFLEDLKWLGINWDEGPIHEGCGGNLPGVDSYFQSQRLDIYNTYIERLIASGHAYRAFETPQEIDAERKKAQAAKQNYRYNRAALSLSAAQIEQYMKESRPHVVRFKVPENQTIIVHDKVRGDVSTATAEIDDFIIRKADGYPMYNFAVVIDDELMGVTHVIRAQEHLSNTPRHILLQDALGFRRPVYAHVSIITNPDGSKMSKRDKDKALRAAVKQHKLDSPPLFHAPQSQGTPVPGTAPHTAPGPIIAPETWTWWLSDKDNQLDLHDAQRLAETLRVTLPEINVDDFRRNGYLPEVMINYLALLGWNPGNDVEKFDRQFLIEHFDFDRIITSPAKFDRVKLLSFNNDAIQALSPEEFTTRWRAHCLRYHPEFVERLSDSQFTLLARANQARSNTLESQIESNRFFIMADDAIVYEQSKAVQEALHGKPGSAEPNGSAHLEAVFAILNTISDWTAPNIEEAVKRYAETHVEGKGGLGKVAQPLRIAVSGSTVSPAIFDTLAILGKPSTLNRITRCLSRGRTS